MWLLACEAPYGPEFGEENRISDPPAAVGVGKETICDQNNDQWSITCNLSKILLLELESTDRQNSGKASHIQFENVQIIKVQIN